jgi:hypothetical protein
LLLAVLFAKLPPAEIIWFYYKKRGWCILDETAPNGLLVNLAPPNEEC